MKFYVASKFENKEAVRHVQALIRAQGHEVTHDWTLEEGSDVHTSSPQIKAYQRECAENDVNGVRNADFLILLDHPGCKGAYIELGIAIAHQKPVAIFSPQRHSVFFELPNIDVFHVVDPQKPEFTETFSKWLKEIAT